MGVRPGGEIAQAPRLNRTTDSQKSSHPPHARGESPASQPSCRTYTWTVAFQRIIVDHEVMGGVPCIRGTRIPVATVVGMVADGMSTAEIVAEFPQLQREDVTEALRYAAAAVDERELPLPVR